MRSQLARALSSQTGRSPYGETSVLTGIELSDRVKTFTGKNNHHNVIQALRDHCHL